MDAVREYLQSKWAIAAVGLVLGVVLGLAYGWWIDPVDWENATPDLLRPDLRADYLRMAIDSYSVNKDVDLAVERYERLEPFAQETLRAVGANPGEVSTTAIQNFSAVIEIFENPDGEQAPAGGEEGAQPSEVQGGEPDRAEGEDPSREPAAGSTAARFILPVCGATLLIGLLLVGALILRGRLEESVEEEDYLQPGYDMPEEFDLAEAGFGLDEDQAPPDELRDEEFPATDIEPLATFRTIYSLGEDSYDDSFSIESPTGDFLGECGVGIGDVIGAGDPRKVSAFEVWLFDKNDIQTVTKVVMSRYAFNDEETRARMAAKGDPVLAQSGEVIYLETKSLVVEARIVDMSYGQSALPNESFFERMTIELRALPAS